jgi:hypothetical protein
LYAYLTVSTRGCDVVRFPDGSTTVTAAGAGAATAAKWRQDAAGAIAGNDASGAGPQPSDTAREDQAAGRRAQYEAAVARWNAELNRRYAGILSVTQGREIREAYEREHPRPTDPDGLDAPNDSADTLGIAHPEVEPSEWWFAICAEANVRAPLAQASAPLPRAALAEVLTGLERDGWSVVHVSEERAVQHEDDLSRTILVGTSILLRR